MSNVINANVTEAEKYHRDCAPHTAEECDINDHHNLEPGLDDCGHTVNAGPGVGVSAYVGTNTTIEVGSAKPSSANNDQDPTHGPGVSTASAKPSSANDDQDPTHGPGVQ